MFSIKFLGPVIFSVIFFLKLVLTNKKNIENFPGSPKYDAKHWAFVQLGTTLIETVLSGDPRLYYAKDKKLHHYKPIL